MSNRFVRLIKSGEIETASALKSMFKSLAKRSHPDLGGSESGGEEFISIRSEYESALKDFEKHRFGAAASRIAAGDRTYGDSDDYYGDSAGVSGVGNVMYGDSAGVVDRRGFYAALAVLVKRGFPKVPRHEKEKLRYEYARYRFALMLGLLGEDGRAAFAAFELRMHGLKRSDNAAFLKISRLLVDLLEFHRKGIAAMRTGIEIDMAGVRAAGWLDGTHPGEVPGTGATGRASGFSPRVFLELLVTDLSGGPVLG